MVSHSWQSEGVQGTIISSNLATCWTLAQEPGNTSRLDRDQSIIIFSAAIHSASRSNVLYTIGPRGAKQFPLPCRTKRMFLHRTPLWPSLCDWLWGIELGWSPCKPWAMMTSRYDMPQARRYPFLSLSLFYCIRVSRYGHVRIWNRIACLLPPQSKETNVNTWSFVQEASLAKCCLAGSSSQKSQPESLLANPAAGMWSLGVQPSS